MSSPTLSGADPTSDDSGDAYALPLWRQLLWGFLFLIMAAAAAFGNFVVIWIVLSQQRMRTVTNYFIGKLNYCSSYLTKIHVV